MSTRTLLCSFVPVLAIAACAKPETPAAQPDSAAAAAAVPNTVHVMATDYAFQVADTLPSGVTTFHLMNQGKESHHLMILRVPFAEVQKMSGGPPPADLVALGGPNAAPPGGSAEATIDLAPGEYTILCVIPSADGQPHVAKGMAKSLIVTAGTATAAMPTPDVTIRLVDYGFELSAPLTAGRHVIRIEDAGPQLHELVFVKLEPGKTVQQVAAWLEKPEGPPPGSLIHGVSPMSVGQANVVTVDLAPGDYGMICFVPDAKDQKPHLLHGMIKQVTVN